MSGETVVAQPKNPPTAGIEIRDLQLTAGNRVLLDDVSADFLNGEITLVVGPSGVGKSLLMKVVAGIVESTERGIRYRGDIRINGSPTSAGKVGFVFQSFALFDEWSPQSNVDFSRSAGGENASVALPEELLKQLNVPTGVPTSRLSGGQKQRLAIARALAQNSPIIVYDEPTSGLDPATGKKVAELIRDTHERFGQTTLVVTHDYHSLLPIADRVFLLDPAEKTLLEVPHEKWNEIPNQLNALAFSRADDERALVAEKGIKKIGDAVYDFFVSTTNWLSATLIGLLSLLPWGSNSRWGFRFFRHYSRLVFGPTALIYLLVAGVISGFVTTYFTFKFLPFASHTEPLSLIHI